MDSLPPFEATQSIESPQDLPSFEATEPMERELPAFEDTKPLAEGSPGQDRGVLTAALEGAGQGIAGPLATLAEKHYGGVKSEDIRATEEAHPIAHTVGEIAGFGTSMMTGLGEAGLIAKAGEGVLQGAEALGITSRIAQGAARVATEVGLYAASNEATKAILDAPNAPGNIASNIGLSAMLGGVTGGAFSGAGMALNKVLTGPVAKDFMTTLTALRGGIDVTESTKKNLGYKMAELWNDKMNSTTIGQVIGAEIGHKVFGPGFGGYYFGKEILGSKIAALLKPMAEKFPNLDIDMINHAINVVSAIDKGNSLVEKATKSLLLPLGGEILNNLMPDDKDLEKLDKRAEELNGDINGAMNIPGASGTLLPDHAMALGKSVGDTVTYLNQQRPNPRPQSPLDTQPEITPAMTSAYKRTLTLAQQPLAILKHVRDGTIIPKDIQDVASMYPEFTETLQHKVTASLVDHSHDENTIPYHTRLAMGLFLAHPLDSTMTPQAIMAAQPKPKPIPPPQTGKVAKNTAKIGNKSNDLYKTASQTAESDRSARKS